MKGEIQLIIGCMFSGKTTELIRRMHNYKHAEKKCLVVKPMVDTRSNDIETHDKQKLDSSIKIKVLKNFKSSIDFLLGFDVIGIDEAQFFSDLVWTCEKLASEKKIVIVSGLDGDFKMEPFGEICRLLPKCESVKKLNAICKFCHEKASFSKRISKLKGLIVIGGSDKYVACCRECYKK